MNSIIAWVKAHRWETVSAVLGAGLLVVSVLFVTMRGDAPEPVSTAGTTTTSSSTTSLPAGTPSTEPPEEEVSTTQGAPSDTSGATAVIVDNVEDVGFQIGIGAAELLIETPVEGGLTRLTALYGNELPDLVGPVRSLRPVSADLLAPFRPVVFTTGGQPFVTGAVTATGASIVTPEESIAFQALERPQPHHVFVTPSVEGYATEALNIPWELGEWPGGDAASQVVVPVSGGVTWRYEGEVFVRYRGEEPQEVQRDFDSEPEPLTRETLILLVANQKSAGYTDSADAEVPTFDVVGGGDLYVLHGGEVLEGTWFRPSQAAGYTFTDESGAPLPIPPGMAYLGVVPAGPDVDISG